VQASREPQIDEPCLIVVHQDIVGFEISVRKSLGVEPLKCPDNAAGERQNSRSVGGALALFEKLAKGATGHQFHEQVGAFARGDMRMQARRAARFRRLEDLCFGAQTRSSGRRL
jgi:hypothetical protein